MNKRQAKKQKKKINKRLIEEYPFLLPRNCWSGKVLDGFDYTFTELNAMPIGWRKAFGKQLLEDVKKELVKNDLLENYRIMQIKEKFGTLRWYDNGATQGLNDILMKYEHISQFTCIECGKVNVPIFNHGWIEPYCCSCFNRYIKGFQKRASKYDKTILDKEYKIEDYIREPANLTRTFIVNRYSKGESTNIEYDVSSILIRMGVDINNIPISEKKE